MPEIKTDCFGFDKISGKCKIMSEDICKQRNCTFYKTWEQYRKDMNRYQNVVRKSKEQG